MSIELILGDCLEKLKTIDAKSVQTCVTSPPYYGLRDYGTAKWEGGDAECDHLYQKGGRSPETSSKQLTNGGTIFSQYEHTCAKCGAIRIDDQIGLEQTPDDYVQKLVQVFREVWRALKDDGTLWLNLGDSYVSNPGDRSKVGGFQGKASPERIAAESSMSMNKHGHGCKPKDLIGIPWMVAFALRADGWYLRSDIIWAKPNPMPESVKDRPTKAHEYIFLLAKSQRYYYDAEAIMEIATGYDGRKDTKFKGAVKAYNGVMPGGKPQSFAQNGHERWRYKNLQADGQQPNTMHLKRLEGEEYLSPVRNKRSVWTINTKGFSGAHFAVMPEKLVEPCILAGSRPGDTVLDPFVGSGTVGAVSVRHGRDFIGIDLNDNYLKIAEKRISDAQQQMRLPMEAE